MTLAVTLSVQKSDLVLREDTVSTITLTNTGQEVLHVVNPGQTKRALRVKIVDIHSGVERIYQETRKIGRGEGIGFPPSEQSLEPGKTFTGRHMLLDLVDGLELGEFDISVGCRYDKGTKRAESTPVRIRVTAGVST
jgi:hypothetical protein